jgi:DNA/RNA-binding domain of Phe-tRNA-synthetase-like protein
MSMEFSVFWCAEVCAQFPNVAVGLGLIKGVYVERENEQIEKLKETVYNEVRSKYNVEKLKDNPIVRAYRDFYWKLDIDPTKTRPSGEALLRRVLHGNELPTISTVVDAYNLASLKTIIPISGFDSEKLNPPFHVRFAENGETFVGIGMNKPMTLTDKMLVLADKNQILCIYPHRDSDRTKITEKTKNVLIVCYGAPGITKHQLGEVVETSLSYIKQVSNGEIHSVKVFSASSN